MALLEPGDVVQCRIGPGFDAAVIAVDRLMAADVGVLETVGLLLGGEQLDILAQRALIAFEGEDMIFSPESSVNEPRPCTPLDPQRFSAASERCLNCRRCPRSCYRKNRSVT